MNDARDRILGQRIARAGDDARRILARPACHGRDQDLFRAYRANVAAIGVELAGLGVRADELAQLATNALGGITRDIVELLHNKRKTKGCSRASRALETSYVTAATRRAIRGFTIATTARNVSS